MVYRDVTSSCDCIASLKLNTLTHHKSGCKEQWRTSTEGISSSETVPYHPACAYRSVGLLKMPLLFWGVKRHRAFLLILKDPIDLDKLHHCKCFLVTWLLLVFSVACFHDLESWAFKQLCCYPGNGSTSAVVRQWLLCGRAWPGAIWDPVSLGKWDTDCICTCGYALSSVVFSLLNLIQLLLQQIGDNIPLVHELLSVFMKITAAPGGKKNHFLLPFQMLAQ